MKEKKKMGGRKKLQKQAKLKSNQATIYNRHLKDIENNKKNKTPTKEMNKNKNKKST